MPENSLKVVKPERFSGIELREAGSMGALFEHVDNVLTNYGVQKGEVNDRMRVNTVSHALHRMINSSKYFSICTIEECAKTAHVFISSERMRFYQPLHCMEWNEMKPEFRTMVVAAILDDFRHVLTSDENG